MCTIMTKEVFGDIISNHSKEQIIVNFSLFNNNFDL